MSTTNVLTVIQARRGSSRLPGKVMMPILDKPLLVRMVERVQKSKLAGTIVVATTEEEKDNVIQDLCNEYGWICFRGHSTDLLDRHYKAGLLFGAKHIVKIPSDVPLIDPAVIDKVIGFYLENLEKYDFVSNLHPPSYPDGNDVEIMPFEVLQTAWEKAKLPMEREHTTPYIWERPEQFRIGNVAWESGLDYSMSHRWTIDYEEDYLFIKRVYEELYPQNPNFGLNDILELLEKNPSIFQINSKYAGVNWYRNHLGELRTISGTQTRNLENLQQ